MFEVNDRKYKVYLLDTNIASDVLKKRDTIGSNIMNYVLKDGVFCFSPYTIWEIKGVSNLYDQFLDVFTAIPALIINRNDYLLEKEIENYYANKKLEFEKLYLFLNTNYCRSIGLDLLNMINGIVKNDVLSKYKAEQTEIFNNIKQDNKVFLYEKQQAIPKKEIEGSIELLAYKMIAEEYIDFARNIANKGEVLSVRKFPSVLTMSYLLHYKFGKIERVGEDSDITDILISSALPYVDCFITENNVAGYIKTISERHEYLGHLEIKTMRDFS